MEYHDPFTWKKEPIPVDQYTVQDQPNPEPPIGGVPPRQQAGPKKNRMSLKVASLCLACALMGGAAGGSVVYWTSGGSGGASNTTVFTSGRPQVELETVSANGQTELSPAEIYANYSDSCVAISVELVTTGFFRQTVTAAGSGFVITEDGYIVTNYHVIEGATSINVTFENGATYAATLVGSEESNDIAVIKIDVTGLTPVLFGDSDQLNVGDNVVTIGNPLGELSFSLSNGVVSALNRTVAVTDSNYTTSREMNMIQTNCTINSGNSGGPLFNQYGEVIGIVSAKYSSDGYFSNSSSVEGLGFAIPIGDVMEMITDIIEVGYVTGKPYLGISVETVLEDNQTPAGARVVYAVPGLCAYDSGIREGDVITAVGDVEVTSNSELITAKNAHQAGDTVNFTILRNGEALVIPVTLSEENAANSELLNEYVNARVAQAEQEAQPQEEQQVQPGQRPSQEQPQQNEPEDSTPGEGDPGDAFRNFFSWPF